MSQTEKEKRKYAVQFYDGYNTIEDTKPIEWEEAKELFLKHLPEFRKARKDDLNAELCIWKDVGDGEYPSYGETKVHFDYSTELGYDDSHFKIEVHIDDLLKETEADSE